MSAAHAQTGKRRRGRVVLVVDDDVDCREMIRNALVEAGHVVLEAGDGAEALRLLLADDQPEPMLIVLDLWLPIMSGAELLRVLKGYHRLSRIPVILTSAGPGYGAEEGVQAGWLPKPFDTERLLALVNERCAAKEPSVASGE
jgi:CheY-like chemotaxis protein